MRKCKIIATIGPASSDLHMLENMILAGVNVVRLNFSHGTHQNHKEIILKVREISQKNGLAVGILQDLQGPKLRIGILKNTLFLEKDEIVPIISQDNFNNENEKAIPIQIPELFDVLRKGNKILLNDGNLQLEVCNVDSSKIISRVINGGKLFSQQGINLPGTLLNIPSLTKKDELDLAFGLSMGVDSVAISFVRSAGDVIKARKKIQKLSNNHFPLLIAKLEKPEALTNLEEIIEVSDGVMVARGDLGVEMDLEEVPVAQKTIIRSANRKNKLVITATQMLESMIHDPAPTRAEASDVANAIFDGSDMVMLSAETAVGDFPVETVSVMDRIINQAEAAYPQWGFFDDQINSSENEGIAIVKAARELAHAKDIAAIVVFTFSGQTANLMAKMRPQVPIIAFTPDEKIYQRLAFMLGVFPHLVPLVATVEEMIKCVEIELAASEFMTKGQKVVLVFGYPLGAKVPPNMTLLHKV